MIAWLNFIIMVLCGPIILYFYTKSVQPAKLEQKIGEQAYKRCATYRMIGSIPMVIAVINYVLYRYFPLPINLPETFPWNYWVSALIAVVLAIPSGYLFVRGMIDAGEETMTPKKEHTLYGGIYKKIRHPQGVGEAFIWIIFAFFLNSPLLVLFSFYWLVIWYFMVMAEEKDLILRYGKDYETYRQNTGAFFPKLTKKTDKENT